MMGNCGGNCDACGGCGATLLLTDGELAVLELLGQIPFLPVARKAYDMIPVCLEPGMPENAEAVLQSLEKKGMIDLDYYTPLKGVDMAAYAGYPVHGSMALTLMGQSVLNQLEIQGIGGDDNV